MKLLLGNLDKPGRAKSRSVKWMNKHAGRKRCALWWGLLFEPRDLWIGVHWTTVDGTGWTKATNVYICLVPCLPLKLQVRTMLPIPGGPMGSSS